MLAELVREALHDAAGGFAFATDIAGAAEEEAEGFHRRKSQENDATPSDSSVNGGPAGKNPH